MPTADRKQARSTTMNGTPAGFDVTCLIGRVEFTELDGDHPYVAAMRCIVEHGAGGGEYSFPSENEGMVHIVIPAAPSFAGE